MDEAWRWGLLIGLYAAVVFVIVLTGYIATEVADWVRRQLQ